MTLPRLIIICAAILSLLSIDVIIYAVSSLAYYVFRYILDEIKQGSIDAAVHRSMSDGELYICTMRYYVVRWVDDEESGGVVLSIWERTHV
jgi:hypothetical protein